MSSFLQRIRELWLTSSDSLPWNTFLDHVGSVLAAYGEGITLPVLRAELSRRAVCSFHCVHQKLLSVGEPCAGCDFV
eukprot:m.161095 g.161095  ORF g.161095 m.161095 type:complete len:77 (-) comp15191_c1_seq12:1167-1397(-)